jgi:hypothetical protein
LKNAAELVNDLKDAFDFAVIESCAAQNVCEAYRPFAENGKAVFQIEYRGEVPGIGGGACSDAKARHFTPLLADLELDGKAEACPKG